MFFTTRLCRHWDQYVLRIDSNVSQVSLDFIFSAVSCEVTGPEKTSWFFFYGNSFFEHLFTEKPTLKPHSCFLTRNKGFTIFYDHSLVYMATVSHSSWYAAFEWNCRKWFPSLAEISDKTLTSPRDSFLCEGFVLALSIRRKPFIYGCELTVCLTHYWYKIIRPQVHKNLSKLTFYTSLIVGS